MSKSTALTKKAIEAAEPREERYELWDSEIVGFGVRINPKGSKIFHVRYRADGGVRCR